MQRDMKSSQPFYGVQTPRRKEIFRQARRRASLTGRAAYESAVRALWGGSRREALQRLRPR